MQTLFEILKQDKDVAAVLKAAKGRETLAVGGVDEAFKALFLSLIAAEAKVPIVYIMTSDFQARKMQQQLEKHCMLYPAPAPYAPVSAAYDRKTDFMRIEALRCLNEGRRCFIVTSIEAVGQKVNPFLFDHLPIIEKGAQADIGHLVETFSHLGYERVDVVEAKGQVAVRGSILDIYPVGADMPVRLDFFDDEIESLKTFDALTQSSVNMIERVAICPAKEGVYAEGERAVHLARVNEEIQSRCKGISSLEGDVREVEENLQQLGLTLSDRYDYIDFRGLETAAFEKSFLSYTQNACVILDQPRQLQQAYLSFLKNYRSMYQQMFEKGKMLRCEAHKYFDMDELSTYIQNVPALTMDVLTPAGMHPVVELSIRAIAREYRNYAAVSDMLSQYHKNDVKILFAIQEEAQRQAVDALLTAIGLNVYDKNIGFIEAALPTGLELGKLKTAIIPATHFAGASKQQKKARTGSGRDSMKFFSDIADGDYVVHDIHGIGIYQGTQQVLSEGVRKDYAVIEYAQSATMYIPIDQMDKVQKYIGSDERKPRLSRLGSADFKESKAKIKRSVKEMAAELVALYSAREQTAGFAFAPDSVWQKEFDASFMYEETAEQLKCIAEIKRDMESPTPMDRLLCGDVGYGKTEVAQRAAFKAVDNGKQVAVLVPTTVLAMQHYNNFVSRFSTFPINIEMLSRFRTKKQQAEIASRVAAGSIDILIGTHRILSDDVRFKDLGLLIIDEEQRFGVKHKEKIKQLKQNVDVLTLTATPIPRTLHMSMVGIRDISLIDEPPANRIPVLTSVLAYDADIVQNAILQELAQGGQVYYVYNNVKDIEKKLYKLRALVPEAMIEYAHGQMSEGKLERMMTDFIQKKFNVFLCTTIIENGLDIPSANTIIIENAHRLGLAQLYQLRGRVGRSERQAYAYIMYPENKILPVDAEKRLKAIRDFTSFGSGHKIAMRDLQIRGAGNILGLSQSGHFGDVGYEMYARILKEVVDEAQGVVQDALPQAEVDLLINAYIPDSYIPSAAQRMDVYREIAGLTEERQAAAFAETLADRFGKLPQSALNIIDIGLIRHKAQALGILKIQQTSEVVKLIPTEKFDASILQELFKHYTFKVHRTKTGEEEIHFKNTTMLPILQYLTKLLGDINSLYFSDTEI